MDTPPAIEFIRSCPACDKVMSYSCKHALNLGNKNKTKCRACAYSGSRNSMFGKCGKDNPNYGRHCSPETKEKIASKRRGTKASPELRQKLSDLRKGENHPNYGKHLSAETREAISKGHIGKVMPQEVRDKISQTLMGRETYVRTEETKKKLSEAHKGKVLSPETKAKIRAGARRGEDNHAWKGGVSSLNSSIRSLPEYNIWRFACYRRDRYQCQTCKAVRVDLHCHHIKHYAEIRKEFGIQTIEEALECSVLWNTSNGITLCIDCHKLEHKKEKEMTEENKEATKTETRLFKVDDNVIAMIRELVQLSLLSGTNIVDHLRTLVLELHPEDPRFLTLSPGFVESYNRMVEQLNLQAQAAMNLAEQRLSEGEVTNILE